ncbi:tRNA (adenosine(37)-N6)-threonylcarbamoyltransferase complex dimerization subunit type 1 TsaB [Desulfonatronovibrio hydrogenovorans]|uniref:tRNA (adenosine(37)-N6)-threonylcarbamoyltransferase complex dimerization subunit type 1 TsaB n=1 Tax=Desulfonatronovibrio hydrogenovorans TaxID=53245 RepID=UPI0004901864|nr:tRNA (adenosine(37)-N6)-threonylcarbamoyltransferase complex dimerization subunit type 1 TsaB [Desulfonatronovibrio hydrogenovorans]
MSLQGPDSESAQPIYLVLNCAEETVQVVFGTVERVLWSQQALTPGRAMRHIAPMIKAGLDFISLPAGNLAGVSCVGGPGSFTGIRMAFAHAQGLSLATRIPMSTISYFEALIRGPGRIMTGKALILIHSRRRQVYLAGYSLPDLTLTHLPRNMSLEDLDQLADLESQKNIHVFGSGLRRNPDLFFPESWNILPEYWDLPRPEILLELCAESAWHLHPLCPEYLRPSDAEENLHKISSRS